MDTGPPVPSCAVDNGGCHAQATCTALATGTACLCKRNFRGNGRTSCVADEKKIFFLRSTRRLKAGLSSVGVDVVKSVYSFDSSNPLFAPYYEGTKNPIVNATTTVTYKVARKRSGEADVDVTPSNATISFQNDPHRTNEFWKTVSLPIDGSSTHVGDVFVVTLVSATTNSGGTVLDPSPWQLDAGAHTITIVAAEDPCAASYPKLFVSNAGDDVDGDGVLDECDTDLAPTGKTAKYLKPTSATASSSYPGLNLAPLSTIVPEDPGTPVIPDASFIFRPDQFVGGYASRGSWLAHFEPRMGEREERVTPPVWFGVSFAAAVRVDELRLINFGSGAEDFEWGRGMKDFEIYGSNGSGAAPAVGELPRPDMTLLATLKASPNIDRAWVDGDSKGLPQVLRVGRPSGAAATYQHYFLRILSGQGTDGSWSYPGDNVGLRKIEFATYE